tara:strand:+ start:580 stop:864 length:285 start_codon:yes stop_codon:yes gene_type:complete
MSTEVEVEVEDEDMWEEEEHPVDVAWQRVYDYQHHTGEFADGGGCEDEDQTILAWQLMGRLTVLGQLIMGAPFDVLVENNLADVKELLEGEQDE